MRANVIIQRALSGDHGTFGIIRYGGNVALTIEPPWIDNIVSVSCIPTGLYDLRWTWSPRFNRMCYIVDDVPGRSGIRIHSGNLAGDRTKGFASHFSGCIGLGSKTGALSGQRAVLLSRPEVSMFEEWADGRTLKLLVTGAEWMSRDY